MHLGRLVQCVRDQKASVRSNGTSGSGAARSKDDHNAPVRTNATSGSGAAGRSDHDDAPVCTKGTAGSGAAGSNDHNDDEVDAHIGGSSRDHYHNHYMHYDYYSTEG